MFSTSECTRINTEGGERCLVGWNTVGMKYISCGSTLTASPRALSPHKSSVLMELCLETHCFCHHTSQLHFLNTIQTFPLMSSPRKKNPTGSTSVAAGDVAKSSVLWLSTLIKRRNPMCEQQPLHSVGLFMLLKLGRLPIKQHPTPTLKHGHNAVNLMVFPLLFSPFCNVCH